MLLYSRRRCEIIVGHLVYPEQTATAAPGRPVAEWAIVHGLAVRITWRTFRKEVSLMPEPSTEWLHRKRAERTIKNLEKNYMTGFYFPSSQEAVPKILEHIPQDSVVGLGDSMTLRQIGIITRLEGSNYHLLDPWKESSMEKRILIQRQVLLSDIFLVGTNAVTLNGELVNMDGRGNRVAAMIFGPKKVLVVAGVNKIVRDVEEGIERIKSIAGPANAKRHEFPEEVCPPCGVSGLCSDCRPPLTICCAQVVIRGQRRDRDRIKVFIIGEELGL